MTIFIGLDVGHAGKDSTGLTVIERTGGKLSVIVSAVVLDMVFPMPGGEGFATITILSPQKTSANDGATDETG